MSDLEVNVKTKSAGFPSACFKLFTYQGKYPKFFIFFYTAITILQGAYFTYFVGILTTLEKRYALDTKIMGYILIADNLSSGLFSIIVGHYAKSSHRPKILTVGMLLTVLSCFLCCVPYAINGPRMDHVSYKHSNISNIESLLCNGHNITADEICNPRNYVAVCILFIGNFLNGCGSVAYYTAGISYLDDVVGKKKAPFYLGALFALRSIGPPLAFYVSSFALSLYENPSVDPGFTNKDPRWVGAWWIGFLILGSGLSVASLPIPFFPKRIHETDNGLPRFPWKKRLKGLKCSLTKIVSNKMLVTHALSIMFQINGIFAYFTYMPKYMESQYRQTASLASFFSGNTSLCTLAMGTVLGGLLIQVLKPKPRYLVGYMLVSEFIGITGLISAMFLGCPSPVIVGLNEGVVNPASNCNAHCGCSEDLYDPVCVDDGTVLYSPCHAGCEDYYINNETVAFFNCSCVQKYFPRFEVKKGFCDTDCDMFLPYFIILTISKILLTMGKVGSILITLRCVSDEDKALALGTVESLVSVFATIPYPLIYGYVIDSMCLIWDENCGKRGSCLLYDTEKFRNFFHSLSAGFLICGTVCEMFVFYFCKDMGDIYGQDTPRRNNTLNIEAEEEIPLQ